MNPAPVVATDAPAPDERCPTGVPGLDDVLGGGLLKGAVHLLQGAPGLGKTTMGWQFLLEAQRRGEPALYITLSETKREIVQVARSHGWSIDGIALVEASAIDALLRTEAQTTVFRPSEMQLSKIADLIVEHLRRIKPARLVFDSIAEFRMIAETPLRYRRQLLMLKQECARLGTTVLLLDDDVDSPRSDSHGSDLAHGILRLEQCSSKFGKARRRLCVAKLRAATHREGCHDYAIGRGGVRVYPRLDASPRGGGFVPEPVASGIPEFDALSGGGLDRGTTTLLTGPAGIGKSMLALQYVVERAAAGEPAMIFAFDEPSGLLLHRARTLGLELQKFVTAGVVSVQQIGPGELSPGEFAARVRHGVESGCRMVVIDSLNGYLKGSPESGDDGQLAALCAFLNHHGVITILIQSGAGFGAGQPEPALAPLADTVVVLRYFESAGEVRRAIAVLKKRGGPHETLIRELRVEPGIGIEVGDPLRQFQGVLAGTPGFGVISDDSVRSCDDRPGI